MPARDLCSLEVANRYPSRSVQDMSFKIELFGGLRLQLQPGSKITSQAAHIIACLAYHVDASRPLTREFFIEQCWPEQTDPEKARNNLSKAIGMIRNALGPNEDVLISTYSHVSLDSQLVTTDVIEFRKHIEAFDSHPLGGQLPTFPAECAQHLIKAVNIYGGPLLPDETQYWVNEARDFLSDQHLLAVEQLIDHFIHLKKYFAALRFAHLAYQLRPDEEKAQHALMRVYVALDRPYAAISQFKKLKRRLRELGLPPSNRSREYYEIILKWLRSGRSMPPPPVFADVHNFRDPDGAKPTKRLTFLAVEVRISNGDPLADSSDVSAAELSRFVSIFNELSGEVLSTDRNLFVVAFESLEQALICSLACQRETAAISVDDLADIQIRIALHTDLVPLHDGLYRGKGVSIVRLTIDRAQYGQIVCSQVTMQDLARTDAPLGVALADMGFYRLSDNLPPQRLYRIDSPNHLREFPLLRIKTTHSIRNAAVSTRFIGRNDEINELKRLIEKGKARFISIVGGPGVGKSRLAEELAESMQEAFNGAVWIVPLIDVAEAHRIAGEIARVIGLPPSPTADPFEQVTEFLEGPRCLLVLDNCEQLVDSARPFIKAFIERVTTLTCIVTSRQSVGLQTEQVFHLKPLEVPAETDDHKTAALREGVCLFEDRAKAVAAEFEITDQNAASVFELVRRLEGIPLAIEFAAQQTPSLSPLEMIAKLDSEERFDLLVTKSRDIDRRSRSYWTTIDWSYRRLSPEAQRILVRLSIFRGGWTVESAQAVCGWDAKADEAMPSLISENLISLLESDVDGAQSPRYSMLESIGDFARSQLGDEEASHLARSHFEYFLGFAEKGKAAIERGRPGSWLSDLDAEHSNLTRALRWAKTHDANLGLRLAIALPRFWEIRGHWRSGSLWLADLLGQNTNGDKLLRARGFIALGNLSKVLGDEPEARDAYNEAFALTSNPEGKLLRSSVLSGMGTLAQDQGNYSEAIRFLEDCLKIKEENGEPVGIANALSNLGYCAYIQDDVTTAIPLLQRAVGLLENAGGVTQLRANTLNNLGGATRINGDYGTARSHLAQSLSLRLELNDRRSLTYSFEEFARLAEALGQTSTAIQLIAFAEALRVELGLRMPTAEANRTNAFLEQLRSSIVETAFEALWLKGMALSQAQAVGMAQQT